MIRVLLFVTMLFMHGSVYAQALLENLSLQGIGTSTAKNLQENMENLQEKVFDQIEDQVQEQGNVDQQN